MKKGGTLVFARLKAKALVRVGVSGTGPFFQYGKQTARSTVLYATPLITPLELYQRFLETFYLESVWGVFPVENGLVSSYFRPEVNFFYLRQGVSYPVY